MQRAPLKPPSIKREPIDSEDATKLTKLAMDHGLGQSGGPSVTIPPDLNESGRGGEYKPNQRVRYSNKEPRSFNFNCKMKVSIKRTLDEICQREGISQGDFIERAIQSYIQN